MYTYLVMLNTTPTDRFEINSIKGHFRKPATLLKSNLSSRKMPICSTDS